MVKYRIVLELDERKLTGKLYVKDNKLIYRDMWQEVAIGPDSISSWSYELGPGSIDMPLEGVRIEKLEED